MAIHGKSYVLAFDPSLTAWGWAVLDERKNIVDYGCLKTEPKVKKSRIRKGDDRIRRIRELNNSLIEVINKYKPELIISELPHGSQSAAGAVMVGICSSLPQTLAQSFKIPIEFYSEADAKKAILNTQKCSKAQIIKAIEGIFNIKLDTFKYINEAVADSLAVYCAALKESSTLQYINNS